MLQFVARETENDIAARYRSVSGGQGSRSRESMIIESGNGRVGPV